MSFKSASRNIRIFASTGLIVLALQIWVIPGNANEPPLYEISVSGPIANIKTSCDDPCRIDLDELVGHAGGLISSTSSGQSGSSFAGKTGSHIDRKSAREYADSGIQCVGNCGSGEVGSEVNFQPRRALREGIDVNINNGRAHFIFYSVVESEKGPVTLKQHSEFSIDRPLIELELHGHDVVVRTDMDESERTDTMRRRSKPAD